MQHFGGAVEDLSAIIRSRLVPTLECAARGGNGIAKILARGVTKILEALPSRIHEVIDRHVAAKPDSVALVEDGETLTYRQFDRTVTGTANALRELGIRPGDRVLIVSENCISLACLLFAVSRLDAWGIVANPRLSPRAVSRSAVMPAAHSAAASVSPIRAGTDRPSTSRVTSTAGLYESSICEQLWACSIDIGRPAGS